MLTEFGKVLRNIRLDNNEILKNMSDKLNISPSFLSSIENGRRIPDIKYLNGIEENYSLDDTTLKKLHDSYDLIEEPPQ